MYAFCGGPGGFMLYQLSVIAGHHSALLQVGHLADGCV
jgi:hypothetical protein